ncbi:very short patch repair endonuclease [Roseospira navarrensis]
MRRKVAKTEPLTRSETMRRVRGTNTSPELIVRRVLYGLGFRYRLHAADLPGKPDIVNRTKKKAIFVHGCFWHGHCCKRGNRRPKTNTEYWRKKIDRNMERDLLNIMELRRCGWDVLVIWECEINHHDLSEKLSKFISAGR